MRLAACLTVVAVLVSIGLSQFGTPGTGSAVRDGREMNSTPPATDHSGPKVHVPPGFTQNRVARVAAPTALAFPGDGPMLVTSQKGRVVSVEGGSVRTVLDLTPQTCSRVEQGLLGVAADPAFAQNRFVYLYYTARREGDCLNRVSRFTFGESAIATETEKVLIDNIPSPRGNHNAGDLQFGPDGNLYVSVGDGGCDYDGSGCHGKNNASRDRHVLLGKVLRISPAGGAPPDNPFTGSDSAECRQTGRTDRGKVCRETYLWGLRNPFRIAFDRNPGMGERLFVNDPGQDRREEINEAVPGADYGWNLREGRCVNARHGRCGSTQAGLTDPIFDYPHSKRSNCRAITGGTFVPQGIWPAPLGGSYLFADFGCGEISRLEADPAGGYRAKRFAGGLGMIVHLAFGPDGGGTALYFTSYSGGGEVRRLRFSPPAETPLPVLSPAR